MKKKLTVFCIYLIILATSLQNLHGEDRFSWDFSECEIQDILFSLSLDSGISITADDTVKGKTDFRFSGDDFDKAFESFLKAARLYVSKKENIWTVSRVQVLRDEKGIHLDASDVKVQTIIEKLAENLLENISHEPFGNNEISVHLESPDTGALLKSLVKFLPGFVLEEKEDGFHFGKESSRKEKEGTSDFSVKVSDSGNIKIEIKSGMFSKVCEQLFEKMGKSFCFIGNADVKACRTVFESDSFINALKLLCNQNNFDYRETDGIFYVFPREEKKNSLVYETRKWTFFPLKYSGTEKIISAFSARFRNIETSFTGSSQGFWANVSPSEKKEVEAFILQTDIQKKTFLIKLNFIQADEFMKRLPPSIDKSAVTEADGNSCLYFSGTEDAYKKILSELELCDRPQKRLKYDLLIIQYDDSDDNQWSSGLKVKSIQKGDRAGFTAQLGSVMGLNLNVLTALGMDFAASLQASLSQNKSRVFADTTLYGIAGKEINFTNTNTYRYRDNNLDPDTGKPVYSGVTREIISGLKLEIKPWVGEDGMITTQVKASVTRRGTDTSSVTGNPPPTSEKVVTTEVCGKSGEPVILSGLVQNNDTDEVVRTPVLSKIPLLGKLFKTEKHISEKTQMVIYLVPFLESEESETTKDKFDKEWADSRKERLCRILNLN